MLCNSDPSVKNMYDFNDSKYEYELLLHYRDYYQNLYSKHDSDLNEKLCSTLSDNKNIPGRLCKQVCDGMVEMDIPCRGTDVQLLKKDKGEPVKGAR